MPRVRRGDLVIQRLVEAPGEGCERGGRRYGHEVGVEAEEQHGADEADCEGEEDAHFGSVYEPPEEGVDHGEGQRDL